jgi:hypothetical protein
VFSEHDPTRQIFSEKALELYVNREPQYYFQIVTVSQGQAMSLCLKPGDRERATIKEKPPIRPSRCNQKSIHYTVVQGTKNTMKAFRS